VLNYYTVRGVLWKKVYILRQGPKYFLNVFLGKICDNVLPYLCQTLSSLLLLLNQTLHPLETCLREWREIHVSMSGST